MPSELTYNKVILDASGLGYNIVEVYPDGRQQVINEQQDVYQAWLAVPGHTPTVIPYVPPEPPTPEQLQAMLDAAKGSKIAAIDAKTNMLISAGFNYSGKTFSLSASAQANWIAMQARFAELVFPLAVSTITDVEFILTSSSDCSDFLDAAFNTVMAEKAGGVGLRSDIMAIYNDTGKTVPVRIAEINAFVDPR